MIIRKSKAFLLIEALITVVIVSTSIIFINHAFTSSLRATGLSSDYLNAVMMLEDKAFDIESPSFAEEESNFSGEGEFMGKDFYWERTVLPLEEEDFIDEEEDIGLERLRFSLRWERNNTEREIEILTYIPVKESLEE